jgi:hypothetical protein
MHANTVTQIYALLTENNFTCNLLRATLQAQLESHIYPAFNATRRALRQFLALSIGLKPLATSQFATNGAAVSAQQSSDLADGLFGFQEAVNLVSFFSAKVLVHLATWTCRFKRP